MESGRSFSTIRANSRKSTLTWWLVISTDQPGANQSGTTPNQPVFQRKHLLTQTFRCRQVLPGEWIDVWFCQPPEIDHTGHPQFLEKRLAFVKGPHHEVWQHLDFVSNRYAHEEITSNVRDMLSFLILSFIVVAKQIFFLLMC